MFFGFYFGPGSGFSSFWFNSVLLRFWLRAVAGALSKPRKRKSGVPAFNGKHLLPLLGTPRGDPGPSAERRCRCTGWILSEWRGVTGTCFAPLLIEGVTSGTAGWVGVDPFEKSSRVESGLSVSEVWRTPWTSAWEEHVGAF
ncbi:hypothetical protein AVEN_113141-1 [Araneus ventricosus]|uniref:Uncharacterized protein n=1 Tax=Araneus ventricosus TaxID=182803 RepID=A0A4Y2U0C7_ARAVE|nr:hypothetical protein AVEN_113141-1 [Araneus ventricosus]